LPAFRPELTLAALALLGAVVYGCALTLLFGRELLSAFRVRRASALATPPGADAPPE
jgi:hypothetical protein